MALPAKEKSKMYKQFRAIRKKQSIKKYKDFVSKYNKLGELSSRETSLLSSLSKYEKVSESKKLKKKDNNNDTSRHNHSFSKRNNLISKNINYLNIKGKKVKGYNILVDIFEHLYIRSKKKNPYAFLFKAVKNVSPCALLIPIRRGRNILKKPVALSKRYQYYRGLKFLLRLKKKQKKTSLFLVQNIVDSNNKVGYAIKKQNELHTAIITNKMHIYLK